MILYRGTTRGPRAIREAGGFYPKRTLPIHEVRKLLLKYCGADKNRKYNPLDLQEYIRNSPQPEFVSTAPSIDCGGYSNKGFIFKIEANLTPYDWSNHVLGPKANVITKPRYPQLLMDVGKLKDAKLIALQHNNFTKEVTFLTPIPMKNIVAYTPDEDKPFISLLR